MQIRTRPRADIAPNPPNAQQSDVGTPNTRAEFDALVARREELRGQQRELSARRNDLLGQRMMAHTDQSRAALDQRMAELDMRQARLDQQLNAMDDAIANGSTRGVTPSPDPFTMFRQLSTIPTRQSRVNTAAIIGAVAFGEALTFVLIGVVLWHTLWKRSLARMRASFGGGDSSARLDQLQRAVDVIAVEIERISENQRYVTKMLGTGDAQQFAVKRKVADPARLSDDG